jgi:hypothetical protein
MITEREKKEEWLVQDIRKSLIPSSAPEMRTTPSSSDWNLENMA